MQSPWNITLLALCHSPPKHPDPVQPCQTLPQLLTSCSCLPTDGCQPHSACAGCTRRRACISATALLVLAAVVGLAVALGLLPRAPGWYTKSRYIFGKGGRKWCCMRRAFMSITVREVVVPSADREEGKGPAGWDGAVPALHSPSRHQPFLSSAVLLCRAVLTLGGTVMLQTTGIVFRLCHEPTRD